MNYVCFIGDKKVYNASIKIISKNLVKFSHPIPNANLTSGFEVLTKNNKVFGDYKKYKTIYKKEKDGSVILSNDGSVYVPPEPSEYVIRFVLTNGEIIGNESQTLRNFEDLVLPEVEMDENYEFLGWNPQIPTEGEIKKDIIYYADVKYIPTLEEVKVNKKAEISAACESTIYAGIDVKIGENWEHFSLKTNDQINLFGKQYQLANGATSVEYHQDGFPCKYYSAEDMLKIITTAMEWVSYHTTYCNALNMWISGATSKDEVNAIFYGAEVPEGYQSEVLKDYLAKIQSEIEEVPNETETAS